MNNNSYKTASLARRVRDKYISAYCENSVMKKFNMLEDKDGVIKIRYRDLPHTEVNGYPFASDRDEDGELCFYFLPNSHEMCVGTTGSGKTTGCLEPRLRALASKKNRPCLFLTDPKGEIFERNAKYLQKMGYRVFAVNFKDINHSDCWNPLAEIYDSWMRLTEFECEAQYHDMFDDSESRLDDYQLQDSREYFYENAGFWTLGKKAFPTRDAVSRYISFEKSIIMSETDDLITQLIYALIPQEAIGSRDPSWGLGARDILHGFIYAMLEDALDKRSGFTRDNMSLMTLQEYYELVRDEVVIGQNPLLKTRKLAHKKSDDLSIRHLKTYFENAPTTTRSYLGVFKNLMHQWLNSKIFTICNGDTVDIGGYEEKPFAIFLITRDYEKSDFTIAGLFIDSIYRKMLLKAEENGGVLSREMYFILDEFGNVPAINDFENKISTSRSRNIWFHMFIQSYAQIERVYDNVQSHCSRIIRDNCNANSFLGSQNFDTKNTFSKECGKKIILSMESCVKPDINMIKDTALLPVSALENIEPGRMYIRRTGLPLIESQFERSYICREFKEDNFITMEEMNIRSVPFKSEKYRYKYLSTPLTMERFAAEKKKEGEDREKNPEQVDVVPEFLKTYIKK